MGRQSVKKKVGGAGANAGLSLAIVCPVFNDWESLSALIADIETTFEDTDIGISMVVVDDCSTTPPPANIATRGIVRHIELISLETNVGHQRAIAIGLIHSSSASDSSFVAVMDSDGEDKPSELRNLVEAASREPDLAIVGQRKKRSEALSFRIFYRIYTWLFQLLTGRKISFGNFVVLPQAILQRLIHNTNIWNNMAATMVHSRLPIRYVPTVRGKRYFGVSKMNFVALVVHGLGAISVFSEAVFVRILVASSGLLVTSILATIAVFVIRLTSTMAVPGWATNVTGFALLIAVQAVMMPIMIAFLLLNNRSNIQLQPKSQASALIAGIRRFDKSPARKTGSPAP